MSLFLQEISREGLRGKETLFEIFNEWDARCLKNISGSVGEPVLSASDSESEALKQQSASDLYQIEPEMSMNLDDSEDGISSPAPSVVMEVDSPREELENRPTMNDSRDNQNSRAGESILVPSNEPIPIFPITKYTQVVASPRSRAYPHPSPERPRRSSMARDSRDVMPPRPRIQFGENPVGKKAQVVRDFLESESLPGALDVRCGEVVDVTSDLQGLAFFRVRRLNQEDRSFAEGEVHMDFLQFLEPKNGTS